MSKYKTTAVKDGSKVWFLSDPHFGHAGLLTKTLEDGSPARGQFSDIGHMHAAIVANWNRVVEPGHKVYCLGDLGNKTGIGKVLPLLNGRKRLILGNHDVENMSFYSQWFEKISSWRHFTEDELGVAMVMTHFPLHEQAFLGRYEGRCLNVHGHLHTQVIRDPRYINISVEQINYTPVSYDWLLTRALRLLDQGGKAARRNDVVTA
jgi:calcineurin-like phosphoesterase family protein